MRHILQAQYPDQANKVKFNIGDVRNRQSIPKLSVYYMIRYLILRLLFLKAFLLMRKVHFKGWAVIHAFKDCTIRIGEGMSIFSSFSSNMLGLYQRCIIVARYGGIIEIGKECGISGSTIYAWKSIKIGDYTRVGANCKIIDNDFHPLELAHRHKALNEEFARRSPIVIGNDCFIGMNSIILKGSVLGNNVVVGAGSVVHGKFPDNVIIAGNPAKIVKYLTPEESHL